MGARSELRDTSCCVHQPEARVLVSLQVLSHSGMATSLFLVTLASWLPGGSMGCARLGGGCF